MAKKYTLSLFIFRRDLRLEDNTGLISALEQSEKVIPCFILDDRQIKKNPYRSDNALEFMFNSLIELDSELRSKGSRLYFFEGVSEKVVLELVSSLGIDAVFVNGDYTPFSKARDAAIEKTCKIPFHSFEDALLTSPSMVHKDDGNPYTIFTPFMRKAREIEIISPQKNKNSNYYSGKIEHSLNPSAFMTILPKKNKELFAKGGRKEGQMLLRKISKLKNYAHERNIPSIDGTSHLSAHHKFGTVSIRESYQAIVSSLGFEHQLMNEIYWRDFFTHIAHHFPHVFIGPFNKKYNGLKWHKDEDAFSRWCKGMTGFPIVDAGMRELNTTGFMHNRVRMVVASFLVKDLHLDWKIGERYFATKLVDYDPCVNNGNWQWSASTGCDAQPYFRVFNPWRQQERFDPECLYIKKWVPELSSFSSKIIHSLWKQRPLGIEYPTPIVSHDVEAKKAIEMFKKI